MFAKEIQSILEESLAVTNAIPEVEISSLEIHGMHFSVIFEILNFPMNYRKKAAIISSQEEAVSRAGTAPTILSDERQLRISNW